jgi:uncharacterized protein YdeI (YjbR/CyaY-like superfamily)
VPRRSSGTTEPWDGPDRIRGEGHDGRPLVHVLDRAEWRTWLLQNHATSTGCWLVGATKASGLPTIPYEDSIEEALCFGWIDSHVRKYDVGRSTLLHTPRKPRSVWSRPNKERVERLIAAGRMEPAGLAAIEAAKANGMWSVLESAEALEVPADLAAALQSEPGARSAFEGFAPSARKVILGWIAVAKRPETRARRIAETARLAAQGRQPGAPGARPS